MCRCCKKRSQGGGREWGCRGGAILAQSTVNAWLLESFKQRARRKLQDQISLFLRVNEELGFPFATLNGSREVWAMWKVCLTTVSIYPQHSSQAHGRTSFTSVTITYLPHCHQNYKIQVMNFFPSLASLHYNVHTRLKPNDRGDGLSLKSINLDRFSIIFATLILNACMSHFKNI